MKPHFPSLIGGIALAVVFSAITGATYTDIDPARFQLEATTNRVFVLDRYTGRVWEKFVTDGSGQTDQGFSQPKIK